MIIVLSAPSGSGKGTVISNLLSINPGICPSISHTSRQPRLGEADGVHYYFTTKERFLDMVANGELIEWDVYQGDHYGTSIAEIERLQGGDRDIIFDITIKGAFAVREHFAGAVLVFLLPPSLNELERRLRNRKTETDEKISGRMAEARREIAYLKDFDYSVVNDVASEAAQRVNSIIISEKCRLKPRRADTIISELLNS